jgi:hypothetical protein
MNKIVKMIRKWQYIGVFLIFTKRAPSLKFAIYIRKAYFMETFYRGLNIGDMR